MTKSGAQNVITEQYVVQRLGGRTCSIAFCLLLSAAASRLDIFLELFLFFDRCRDVVGTRSIGLLTFPCAPYSASFRLESILGVLVVSPSPSSCINGSVPVIELYVGMFWVRWWYR